MAVFQVAVQIAQQVHYLTREVSNLLGAAGKGKGGCGQLVAAGRAPDAQVYPSRVQRLQHSEVLGHFERAVVGQHYAAAAHPDGLGPGRHLADEYLGAGAGEVGQAVVFGQPVALIAQFLGYRRKLDGLPERLTRGATRPHRRLVDHTQYQLLAHLSPSAIVYNLPVPRLWLTPA